MTPQICRAVVWVLGVASCAAYASVLAAPLSVSADSSFMRALDEQVREFQTETGVAVQITYDDDRSIATRIAAGEHTDVWTASDGDLVDRLIAQGSLTPWLRLDVLEDRLVFVAAAGSRARLRTTRGSALRRALGARKLVTLRADASSGRLAERALRNLGVWNGIAADVERVNDTESAIRALTQHDVGFAVVYASEAIRDARIHVAGTLPANATAAIVHPIVAVARDNQTTARAFVDYLNSRPAEMVWRRWGYVLRKQ